MNIFYNLNSFKSENIKFLLIIGCIFLSTFVFLSVSLNLFLSSVPYIWEVFKVLPIIFGILSFAVLSLSLSYLTYQSFSKVICFAAVVYDSKNSSIVNAFLISLAVINFLTCLIISSFIAISFFKPAPDLAHVIYVAQTSLIPVIAFCLRILESKIDQVIKLGVIVESNSKTYSPNNLDKT